MQIPGASAKKALPGVSKYARWSFSMVPQLGVGGFTPMPTKLKPASIKMAEAKSEAAITIMGPMIFGKICLMMILALLYPNPRAACTYSISRRTITDDRTMRAVRGV